MRFVRYRKRNYGNSIQEPIDKDNLNWTRRDFWDSSGFWWPTGITNYNKHQPHTFLSRKQIQNQSAFCLPNVQGGCV